MLDFVQPALTLGRNRDELRKHGRDECDAGRSEDAGHGRESRKRFAFVESEQELARTAVFLLKTSRLVLCWFATASLP
jgi:hypothetical protein